MIMPKKILGVALLLGLAGVSHANTTNTTKTPQTPPNTIDMTATANGSGRSYGMNSPAFTGSPALTQAQIILSPDMQGLVTPSVPTSINREIERILAGTLTPEQINLLKANEAAYQKAVSSPYVRTPAPVVRSMAVNLSPDATPPIMRLSAGMISTLVFLDEDGNPWEIESMAADSGLYRLHSQAAEGRSANTVLIEPLTAFNNSNLVVLLKGKATPVIVMLTTGQDEVDIRVDARVAGVNPDAQYTPSLGGVVRSVSNLDETLLSLLDGSQPDSAKRLVSSDPAASAWQVGNDLYVKTRLDVLYPAFKGKASTAEGVHVYRFEGVGLNRSISFLQRGGQPVNISFDNSPYYAK